MNINILYEDNYLIIIENPESQTHSKSYKRGYLKNVLKKHLMRRDIKKDIYLRQLHLIEYPVAGTQIFAKSSKAYYRLVKQMKAKQIKQLYFAVVNDNFFNNSDTLTNYLSKDNSGRLHLVAPTHPKKFQATLPYIVIEPCENFTLIAIPSAHGKIEQIRLQLMAWGHSILGDDKYCWNVDETSSLALCMTQIRCYHPIKRQKMSVISPLPLSYPWNLFNRFPESNDAVNFVHQQLQSNKKK